MRILKAEIALDKLSLSSISNYIFWLIHSRNSARFLKLTSKGSSRCGLRSTLILPLV